MLVLKQSSISQGGAIIYTFHSLVIKPWFRYKEYSVRRQCYIVNSGAWSEYLLKILKIL